MIVTPFDEDHIPQVLALMERGRPFITPRTPSDYWLYARLFGSSCPIAREGDLVIGVIIAFRSQDDPSDVYIQDVITHPDHRRNGVAHALLDTLTARATSWGCTRIYLTSEPENIAAHATWTALGYTNLPGDHKVDGISVISNFKGPGKHRAVYAKTLDSEARSDEES